MIKFLRIIVAHFAKLNRYLCVDQDLHNGTTAH